MTRYVLGFAFTEDLAEVALILKQKGPPEIVDKWNGVGGKIEPGETARYAMAREFLEETGVAIPAARWATVTCIGEPDYAITVFTTVTDDVRGVRTMEAERVELLPVETVRELAQITAPNVVPLYLPLSLERLAANRWWAAWFQARAKEAVCSR